MWPSPQETVNLVTFTEEILNEKLHFLCSNTKAKNGEKFKIAIVTKTHNFKKNDDQK